MLYCCHLKKPSDVEGFSFLDIEKLIPKKREIQDFRKLSLSRKIEVYLTRKALYKIIQESLGLKYNEFQIEKHNSGKPFLVYRENLKKHHLSYSHSRSSVFLVFSEKSQVGVDVEEVSRFLNHKAFNRWLSPKEKEHIKTKKNKEKIQAKVWTRKEAMTKLTGLAYNLKFSEHSVLEDEVKSLDSNQSVFFKTFSLSDEMLSIATYRELSDRCLTFIE